jgi:hypothetical protein
MVSARKTLRFWNRSLKSIILITNGCRKVSFEIKNNPVERIIRPLGIGRNNWLCAGSQAGAKWMAAFSSIIATYKLSGINPHDYLLDIVQLPDSMGKG